ncbi:MAG: hypothetical protein FWF47_01600 [Clostridia bacterium]|nr:hypothetical protein [Clostridia bacterium]
MAEVRIQNVPGAEINPFIYGNFMEFIERHISGMWAEMLENRRMEDCLPGKSVPEYWQPYTVNNTARFALHTQAYSGSICQQVTCMEDLGGFTGLMQKGLGVTKGRGYAGSVYLRGHGVQTIEIGIGRDYGVFFQPYAAAVLDGVSGEWQKFCFSFTADTTDDDAALVIRFAGNGIVWIDHPSIMPADNMDGWRKDVVTYIKQLKPGILRFPGGCYADTYHWRNAIGPRDARKPQHNFHWSNVPYDVHLSDQRTARHWRPTEPNDVGIDELMRLCELTDTQALICVNLGTGTAQEAAAWVEYCNGSADTPYGALRAQNGHPVPYGIGYWQIGNEMYGGWEAGYCGRDGYIKGYKAFHQAMSAVDPALRFVIDGFDSEWNRAMMRECKGLFEYIDVHFYPGWEDIQIDANPVDRVYRHIFTKLQGIKKQIDSLRRDIREEGLTGMVKAAVCEYNISSGGWGDTRVLMGTQGAALFTAGLICLMVQNADLIQIGSFSNLTNAWWSSAIRTRRESIHATPSYHALSLFAHSLTGRVLPCVMTCEHLGTGHANSLNRDPSAGDNRLRQVAMDVKSIPAQAAVAAFDIQAGAVTIAVINFAGDSAALQIRWEGFASLGAPSVCCTAAPDMCGLNDFLSPDRIAPVYSQPAGDAQELTLAPCSLTFITVPVKEKA